MDSYNEYRRIEQHIGFSKRLQNISTRGLHYLREIEIKKRIGGRRKYEKDVHGIHHLLGNIIKPRVMLCNNLYSSLIYYLDEMLFYEVQDINDFVIEDDKYPLSFVYFNNAEWNPENDRIQPFVLENNSHMNETEAALLLMLLEDYNTLLQDLLQDFKDEKKTCHRKDRMYNKIYTKVRRIISRLDRRLTLLKTAAFKIVEVAFATEKFESS